MEPSSQPPADPTPEDIRAELERVLSSRCFAHAGRASEFLRFVVEETLAGAGPRLKGYTIGTEVFGRPPDFDPQVDPLVRVEAGRLRSRLAEYYQNEGAGNAVQIELPRGGYAVKWRRREPAPVIEEAVERRAVRQPSHWRPALAAIGLLLLTAVTVLLVEHRRPTEPPAAVQVIAAESPRVIVTPFESFGLETPELDEIAAGLTEEIMLALGRLDVRVIAAEPRWLDAGRVGEMSSRDYVLSGSVRLADHRVRIAARLIERGTGAQLWSRAYDKPRGGERDAALQAVAEEIAGVALPYGPIFDAELVRTREGSPSLRDCLVRYLDYRRTMDDAPFRAALECYQSLSLREPTLAGGWAGLGMLYLDDYGYGYGHSAGLEASLTLAREAIERSLALNRDLLLANMALARLQLFDGRHDELRRTVDAILAREPANSEARAYLGATLAVTGDPRGIELVDEARAGSQRQPSIVYMAYAVDHLRHGRPEEALEWAERVATPNWFPSQMVIAASAGLCGDERVAARARTRLLEIYPNFEAEAIDLFRRWQHDPALDRALVEGLNKAGFAIVAPEQFAMP
jgi:adenylate cyclase